MDLYGGGCNHKSSNDIFFFLCVYVDFLSHRGGELKICCARTAAIDPVR